MATEKADQVGLVNGLAWTEAGGDILPIEATKMPGKGTLILTGHLGQVMQESAQAAFTYARSIAGKLGLKEPFHKTCDIHVHVPQGAIPKDGPSAGIAIASAIISALTCRPIRRDIAMTGEITLRGRSLEIGGVKEKVLAAHRHGIRMVILPKHNEKDLVDVPDSVRREVQFKFVESMDEVLPLVFGQAAAKTADKKRSAKR